MTCDPIAEVDSPGKGSRESIGKVTESCRYRSEPPDEYSEYDTREEEYTCRSDDLMEVLIELCCDDSAEERSGYGFREEYASLWTTAWYHRAIECGYDHTTDHRSGDHSEVVFSFLTF